MAIDKNQTQTLAYYQGEVLVYSPLTNGVTITIIYQNPITQQGTLLGGYIALMPLGLNYIVTSLTQLIPQQAIVKGLALIGTRSWNQQNLENMLNTYDKQSFYPAYENESSQVGLNHDMLRTILHSHSIDDGLLTVIGNLMGIDMLNHKMNNYYVDLKLPDEQSNQLTVVWKDAKTVEVRLNQDKLLNTFTDVGR